MLKLMKADFHRLKKNKLFWIFSVLLFVYFLYDAVSMTWNFNIFSQAAAQETFRQRFEYETAYINFIVVILFSCIFSGSEFSSKTVRNKIFCGHTRTEIYLSALTVNMAASAVFIFPVVFTEIAAACFGFTKFYIGFILFLIALLLSFSATSLSLAAAFITGSRFAALIISGLVIFSMFYTSYYAERVLAIPREYREIISVNGEPYIEQTVLFDDDVVEYGFRPNPDYPSEEKKKLCSFICDILPGSQFRKLAKIAFDNKSDYHIADFRDDEGNVHVREIKGAEDLNEKFSLYGTVIFIFAVNALGIIVFNKKELK